MRILLSAIALATSAQAWALPRSSKFHVTPLELRSSKRFMQGPVGEIKFDNENGLIKDGSTQLPQSQQLNGETYMKMTALDSNFTTLVEAIEKLRESQEKLYTQDLPQDRPKLQSNIQENQISMERNTVRLDGIEAYAVLSSLNLASSITCLNSYVDGQEYEGALDKLLDLCFVISNSLGILCALNATLVFSLVAMYGRTALGIGKDLAFSSFLEKTYPQRHQGFQTFFWSLHAFMLQEGM